ncbi:hypothetical protein J6590_008634 [Homalodisca vitripennis]|nr:hypothetical protein J6590_008634 [Homalodisca vitripennis]
MKTPYKVTLGNGTVVEKQDFTLDFDEISKVTRASFFGYVATQILGGWLGACLGGSRVFGVGVASTALFCLVTPFVIHTGVANLLIAIRFFQGLFEGVTYPSIIAVWSRWAPPQERARLVTTALSGSYFAIVVTPPVLRLIVKTLGWSYVFYITSIIGLIWFAVWWTVVKDKPEDDPHISTEELKYLRDNLDCGPNDYIPKHIIYPWDKFVTSMPVWAIVVALTCMCCCFNTLIIMLPIFMRGVYDYDVSNTGLMSFLPYLVMAVLMPVAGTLADWLRNSEVLTTTQEEKESSLTIMRRIEQCNLAVCFSLQSLQIRTLFHGELAMPELKVISTPGGVGSGRDKPSAATAPSSNTNDKKPLIVWSIDPCKNSQKAENLQRC